MPAVNLRHIEIFHAVMTAGNLTEAARLLHTSQPTVSRELARFEKVIGLTLFERTRGRLHPTVQGLRLFEEVQRSWYGLDRIVSAADSLREFRQGELSVVCLPVFSQSFLPALLQPFLARYPDVNLTIVPQESPLLEEWLSAQRHDLGLTETLATPAGTARHELLAHRQLPAAAGYPVCRTSGETTHGGGDAQRRLDLRNGARGSRDISGESADGAGLCRQRNCDPPVQYFGALYGEPDPPPAPPGLGAGGCL